MIKFRIFCSITLAGLFCLLSGCGGGSSVAVNGKLVLKKPAVTLKENDTVQITLVPLDAKGAGAIGEVSTNEMSFQCEQVTPGSYRVEVNLQEYLGEQQTPERQRYFQQINEAFGEKSPLKYEVNTDSVQIITIDLNQGVVTKN